MALRSRLRAPTAVFCGRKGHDIMAKTTIRNMRLNDRYWDALESYARMRGLLNPKSDGEGDRTKAMIALMEDNIPAKCWPKEKELEGQLGLL